MSHGRDTSPKPYGVCAEFLNGEALLSAVKQAREAGWRHMEGYSPIPVHGLTEAMEWQDGRLGWAVFMAGCSGAAAGLGLQWYTSAGITFGTGFIQYTGLNGYAHNVGGKPLFSLPAFVPVTYEMTILLAGLTAAGAMLAMNGLPKPHHPAMNAEAMQRVSADRFVLFIEATDPNYDEDKAAEFLETLKPVSVERVWTSEGY